MKDNIKKLVLSFGLSIGVVAVIFLGFWLWTLIPPKSYSAEEIYNMAAPSVVKITVTSRNGAVGYATGFFYDEKGTVITRYDVIRDRISASIKTYDGGEYEVVSVLGYDEAKNIAILDTRCQTSKALSFRPDNLKVKKGEPAYVIRNTFDVGSGLSDGVISAMPKKTDKNAYIITTAAIVHEDSGAPLMDKYGYVVGIASFADVQKLNIATPVYQVESVQANSPTLLSELFQQEITYLCHDKVIYDAELNNFVVVFQIGDEEGIPIQSEGRVAISMKNDDGVIVYTGLLEYDESDYSDLYLEGTDDSELVTLYINAAKILKGRTPYGTIRVTVYVGNTSFETSEYTTHQLPYKKSQASN